MGIALQCGMMDHRFCYIHTCTPAFLHAQSPVNVPNFPHCLDFRGKRGKNHRTMTRIKHAVLLAFAG